MNFIISRRADQRGGCFHLQQRQCHYARSRPPLASLARIQILKQPFKTIEPIFREMPRNVKRNLMGPVCLMRPVISFAIAPKLASGKEAMRVSSSSINSTALLLLTLGVLPTIGATTGCQSAGSRLAWMNPWSRTTQDTSLIARSAPQLPSAQATAPGGATAVAATTDKMGAKASGETAPAFDAASAATIAGAPAAKYPTTPGSAPGFPTTADPGGPPKIAAAKSSASTSDGPYDPSEYQPAVATTPSYDADRYANGGSRYSVANVMPETSPATSGRYGSSASAPMSPLSPPSDSSPATSSGVSSYASKSPNQSASDLAGYPSATPAASYPATQSSTAPSGDAYPPTVSPPARQTPFAGLASSAPVSKAVTPASAELQLDAPAGQYRPGGTSTYPVSVASRPAATPAASSPYPATSSVYPATSSGEAAPAPSSSPIQPASPYPTVSPYPATPSYR